jgi:peptidoglycan/xylan/chitin deacetylase (PgdA/CDA1 family)
MAEPLYDYSPIVERPKRKMPNGARIAVWLGVNIEHYDLGKPGASLLQHTAAFDPDALNHGWRDYGPRVGIWRMIDLFDRVGARASVLLNADVALHNPQIIQAGVDRNWVWLGHGRNNSIIQTGIDEDFERSEIHYTVDTIEKATGARPRGWLGPALTETYNTPRLLREAGLDYVCDWCADELPFDTRVPGLISVPYAIELNDATTFIGKNLTGPEFYEIVMDQFEVLYEEGATRPRVMCLALHPFLVGQPFRIKYLAKALEHIAAQPDVWMTTSDEIADWYLARS